MTSSRAWCASGILRPVIPGAEMTFTSMLRRSSKICRAALVVNVISVSHLGDLLAHLDEGANVLGNHLDALLDLCGMERAQRLVAEQSGRNHVGHISVDQVEDGHERLRV